MTYAGPRTLVSSTASTPARSTGRARAGLRRSTTASHRPGSAGPTGLPGARPARASQTLIRVSTYVTLGLSLADGEWRLWARAVQTRVPVRETAIASVQSRHKGCGGWHGQPP